MSDDTSTTPDTFLLDDDGLTPKERRFVTQYVSCNLNASEAARRCGYHTAAAHSYGWDLLQKAHIQRAIIKVEAEVAHQAKIKAYQVLRELALVAFSDHGHYEIDDEGNVTAPGNREAIRAVASITRKTRKNKDGSVERETKYTLWPKVEALKALAEHIPELRSEGDAGQGPRVLILRGVDGDKMLGRIPEAKKDEEPILIESHPVP